MVKCSSIVAAAIFTHNVKIELSVKSRNAKKVDVLLSEFTVITQREEKTHTNLLTLKSLS